MPDNIGNSADATRVFISYRRLDAGGYAGWIHYCLRERYGKDNVFRDVASISGGERWKDAIDRSIRQADVVLALIGEAWASVLDPHGKRRLEDPEDLVRLEIETAFRLKRKVVPVLIENAQMPPTHELPGKLRELPEVNAATLRNDRWDADIERLSARIDELAAGKARRLTGQEVYDRYKSSKNAPAWIGRNGGLRGKAFRGDLNQQAWKDYSYEVQFGGNRPNNNWFSIAEFATAVDESVPNGTPE